MADSEAARQRRRRAHAAGDHSLCTTRCDTAAVDRGGGRASRSPTRRRSWRSWRAVWWQRTGPTRAGLDLGRVLLQVLQAMGGQEPPEVDEVDRIRAEWEAGSDGV